MAFAKARDEDAYAWLLDQARRLRACKPALVDWMGLAEELDDIVAQQRTKAVSHLRIILTHLLKWAYSRIRRSDHSWRKTLIASRLELADILNESATLRNQMPEFARKAYEGAKSMAGTEMRLSRHEWQLLFRPSCPWTESQILEEDFPPDIAASANGRK